MTVLVARVTGYVGGRLVPEHRRTRRTQLRADDAAVRPRRGASGQGQRPVPLLTPRLSSHWVGLITPGPAGIAKPLVESLRHEAVRRGDAATAILGEPEGGLTGFDDAVRLALRRIQDADVATHWSSASYPGAPSDPLPIDPDWAGGSLYLDERDAAVDAPPRWRRPRRRVV